MRQSTMFQKARPLWVTGSSGRGTSPAAIDSNGMLYERRRHSARRPSMTILTTGSRETKTPVRTAR